MSTEQRRKSASLSRSLLRSEDRRQLLFASPLSAQQFSYKKLKDCLAEYFQVCKAASQKAASQTDLAPIKGLRLMIEQLNSKLHGLLHHEDYEQYDAASLRQLFQRATFQLQQLCTHHSSPHRTEFGTLKREHSVCRVFLLGIAVRSVVRGNQSKNFAAAFTLILGQSIKIITGPNHLVLKSLIAKKRQVVLSCWFSRWKVADVVSAEGQLSSQGQASLQQRLAAKLGVGSVELCRVNGTFYEIKRDGNTSSRELPGSYNSAFLVSRQSYLLEDAYDSVFDSLSKRKEDQLVVPVFIRNDLEWLIKVRKGKSNMAQEKLCLISEEMNQLKMMALQEGFSRGQGKPSWTARFKAAAVVLRELQSCEEHLLESRLVQGAGKLLQMQISFGSEKEQPDFAVEWEEVKVTGKCSREGSQRVFSLLTNCYFSRLSKLRSLKVKAARQLNSKLKANYEMLNRFLQQLVGHSRLPAKQMLQSISEVTLLPTTAKSDQLVKVAELQSGSTFRCVISGTQLAFQLSLDPKVDLELGSEFCLLIMRIAKHKIDQESGLQLREDTQFKRAREAFLLHLFRSEQSVLLEKIEKAFEQAVQVKCQLVSRNMAETNLRTLDKSSSFILEKAIKRARSEARSQEVQLSEGVIVQVYHLPLFNEQYYLLLWNNRKPQLVDRLLEELESVACDLLRNQKFSQVVNSRHETARLCQALLRRVSSLALSIKFYTFQVLLTHSKKKAISLEEGLFLLNSCTRKRLDWLGRHLLQCMKGSHRRPIQLFRLSFNRVLRSIKKRAFNTVLQFQLQNAVARRKAVECICLVRKLIRRRLSQFFARLLKDKRGKEGKFRFLIPLLLNLGRRTKGQAFWRVFQQATSKRGLSASPGTVHKLEQLQLDLGVSVQPKGSAPVWVNSFDLGESVVTVNDAQISDIIVKVPAQLQRQRRRMRLFLALVQFVVDRSQSQLLIQAYSMLLTISVNKLKEEVYLQRQAVHSRHYQIEQCELNVQALQAESKSHQLLENQQFISSVEDDCVFLGNTADTLRSYLALAKLQLVSSKRQSLRSLKRMAFQFWKGHRQLSLKLIDVCNEALLQSQTRVMVASNKLVSFIKAYNYKLFDSAFRHIAYLASMQSDQWQQKSALFLGRSEVRYFVSSGPKLRPNQSRAHSFIEQGCFRTNKQNKGEKPVVNYLKRMGNSQRSSKSFGRHVELKRNFNLNRLLK